MEYYDDDQNDNIDEAPQEIEDSQNYNNSDNKKRPKKQTNQMALASMICGIVGLISVCCCVAFPIAIIAGAAAICFSFFSKKGEPFTGQAVAGLVLGILAVLFGLAAGFYIIFANIILNDPNMAPLLEQIESMMPPVTQ